MGKWVKVGVARRRLATNHAADRHPSANAGRQEAADASQADSRTGRRGYAAIRDAGAGSVRCGFTPTKSLERLSAKLDQTPATDARGASFSPVVLRPDGSGRSGSHGPHADSGSAGAVCGLQHEVVLLGVRDHLELWDAAALAGVLDGTWAKFDKVAEEAFRNASDCRNDWRPTLLLKGSLTPTWGCRRFAVASRTCWS